MKYDFKELERWQKIGIACLLVVIPGIIGWLIEFFFGWYDNGMKDVYWKGGNFLPWINMYSIGTFLIIAFTYRYREKPLKVLLISILVSGLFELLTGLIFDKVLGIRYWNYKNEVLNFHGYICLLSLTGFGLGGIFAMYILLPFLIKMSKIIPKKVFITISVTLCSLVLIDEFYNLALTKLFGCPRALDLYEKYFHFKFL